MSVALEQAGIDYHVVLAQNALQLCLDQPELQAELISGLIKQTSRPTQHKQGVQVKGSIKLKHPRVSPAFAIFAIFNFSFYFFYFSAHFKRNQRRFIKTKIAKFPLHQEFDSFLMRRTL